MPRRFGFQEWGAGRWARQFDASILWANALAIGRDNSVDPVDKFYNGYFAHLQITKGLPDTPRRFRRSRRRMRGLRSKESSLETLTSRWPVASWRSTARRWRSRGDHIQPGDRRFLRHSAQQLHGQARGLPPGQRSCLFRPTLRFRIPDPDWHTLTVTGTVTASSAIADPFGGSSASALFTGAGSRLSTGVSEDFLPGTLYTIRGWALCRFSWRFNRACLHWHNKQQCRSNADHSEHRRLHQLLFSRRVSGI